MDEPRPLSHGDKMRLWHASRTPEQKAEWRKRVSAGTTAGMDNWHAGRSEEHKALANQRIAEAALCNSWRPRPNNNGFKKGHKAMSSPEALARATQTRMQKASIKRIMQEVVSDNPEVVRDCLLAGLLARPPHSAPYLIIAAQDIDGRPREAEPPVERPTDLSDLTYEQLVARAIAVATRLRDDAQERAELARERAERCSLEAPQGGLPVIDLVPNSASAGLEKL